MLETMIGMFIPIILSVMTFSNRLEIGERCFEIFLTHDDFAEMSTYSLHMAGIAQLRPPYLVERTHPTIHTLLFTTKGRGVLTTENGVQPIEEQTMTVIPANTPWRFEIDGDEWDMCWILLPTTARWDALIPQQAEIRATSSALTIFHLCHVLDQERALTSDFQQATFGKLVSLLEYNLKQKQASLAQGDRLAEAFVQVEQSLHKPWSVADISSLTFYSEPHLFRLCQQRYGRTPMQMIRSLRIHRAKQLLEHTDWPLSEIASRIGFSDQFNFSNRFKKEVGLSPVQFRKGR